MSELRDNLTPARVAADGKCLAQCRKCGVWREVRPRTVAVETFFEVLEAEFCCCGLHQTASFMREKDAIDFH